jgi:hypothetical protein
MTDHPRFQVARSRPEDCHRQHHGAALVEWVFRAADWWLKCRGAEFLRPAKQRGWSRRRSAHRLTQAVVTSSQRRGA